jgi:adenosylcobinamide-phosphate synthase
MAGALDLALAGPRRYHGEVVIEPSLNGSGSNAAGGKDITSAVAVFHRACDCLAVLVALLLLVVF